MSEERLLSAEEVASILGGGFTDADRDDMSSTLREPIVIPAKADPQARARIDATGRVTGRQLRLEVRRGDGVADPRSALGRDVRSQVPFTAADTYQGGFRPSPDD